MRITIKDVSEVSDVPYQKMHRAINKAIRDHALNKQDFIEALYYVYSKYPSCCRFGKEKEVQHSDK